MIRLKDIGKFEELPQMAMHIYNGNIPQLEAPLEQAGILKRESSLANILR